jgi:hypothetical protein
MSIEKSVLEKLVKLTSFCFSTASPLIPAPTCLRTAIRSIDELGSLFLTAGALKRRSIEP